MTARSTVEKFMFDPRVVRDFGTGVAVATSCLYPSMSAVTVFVEGGEDYFVVHDNAGAIHEASGAAARFDFPERIMHPVAKGYGLSVSKFGSIHMTGARANEVGSAIVMVANASKDAAAALLARHKPVIARDAKDIVRQILHRRFAEGRIHSGIHIAGASKSHKFDYAVDFENGSRLLLDVVVPDASSINSAIVASFDVSKRSTDEKIIQRIVYDDMRKWNPQDLDLLSTAGRPVRLSSLSDAIERLAA
jgi:hypothetical protein